MVVVTMRKKSPFKFCTMSNTKKKYCISRIPSEGPITPPAAGNNMSTENDSETQKYSLDYALKATGRGKYHMYLLIVCGFSMMSASIENSKIGFVMPYMKCEMTISTTQQGLMSSAIYAGTIVSSQIWGFLCDTNGRRPVLLISMAGIFIFALLSAFIYDVTAFIVIRLIIGIFTTGVQASTYPYISEFYDSETRRRACSFVTVFMPAAYIFLTLLAWAIIPMQWDLQIFGYTILPWRIYLLLSNLLSGIVLICLYRLPESPKFLLSTDHKEETLEILRKMYATNTHCNVQEYPVRDLVIETTKDTLSNANGIRGFLKLLGNRALPLFKPPVSTNLFKFAYLMFALHFVGSGLFSWFPYFLTLMEKNRNSRLCKIIKENAVSTYMDSDNWLLPNMYGNILPMDAFGSNHGCKNQPHTLIFKILLGMGVLYVTVSILISYFIDKVNRKILFCIWISICAISSVIISSVPEFYTVSIAFIIFLSTGICSGIINATAVTEFPNSVRAMASCLIIMIGRVGSISGSNITGFLLKDYCSILFRVSGFLILTCVIVFAFLKLSKPNTDDVKKCLSNAAEVKICA